MLAKIYAHNIRGALNKTTSHPPLHQPLKETSTTPMLSSSSCSYVHISPQPTPSPPNFAIYPRCHHRPQFKRRRQKNSKPANMESKRDCSESDDVSDDVSDSDFGESDNVSDSNFNFDGVENSSVSYPGCVKPFMFSMLFVVLSFFVLSFRCVGWDGETIGKVNVRNCVFKLINVYVNVKGIFCDLLRPVDKLTSTSLKILFETLPTKLKWIFLRHHYPSMFFIEFLLAWAI